MEAGNNSSAVSTNQRTRKDPWRGFRRWLHSQPRSAGRSPLMPDYLS